MRNFPSYSRFSLEDPRYAFILESLIKKAEEGGGKNNGAPPKLPEPTPEQLHTALSFSDEHLKNVYERLDREYGDVDTTPLETLGEEYMEDFKKQITELQQSGMQDAQGKIPIHERVKRLIAFHRNPELFKNKDVQEEYLSHLSELLDYGVMAYATRGFTEKDPQAIHRRYVQLYRLLTSKVSPNVIDLADLEYVYPNLKGLFTSYVNPNKVAEKKEEEPPKPPEPAPGELQSALSVSNEYLENAYKQLDTKYKDEVFLPNIKEEEFGALIAETANLGKPDANGIIPIQEALKNFVNLQRNPELLKTKEGREQAQADAQLLFRYGLLSFATRGFTDNDLQNAYRRYTQVYSLLSRNTTPGVIDWADFEYLYPNLKGLFTPQVDPNKVITKTEKVRDYLQFNEWIRDQRVPVWQKLLVIAGIPMAIAGVVLAALGGEQGAIPGLVLAALGLGGAAATYFATRNIPLERTVYTAPPHDRKMTPEELFGKEKGVTLGPKPLFNPEDHPVSPLQWEPETWRTAAFAHVNRLPNTDIRNVAMATFARLEALRDVYSRYKDQIEATDPNLSKTIEGLINEAFTTQKDAPGYAEYIKRLDSVIEVINKDESIKWDFPGIAAFTALNYLPTRRDKELHDAVRACVEIIEAREWSLGEPEVLRTPRLVRLMRPLSLFLAANRSTFIQQLISGSNPALYGNSVTPIVDALAQDEVIRSMVALEADPTNTNSQVYRNKYYHSNQTRHFEVQHNLHELTSLALRTSKEEGPRLSPANQLFLIRFLTDISAGATNKKYRIVELAQAIDGEEYPVRVDSLQKIELTLSALRAAEKAHRARYQYQPIPQYIAEAARSNREVQQYLMEILRLYIGAEVDAKRGKLLSLLPSNAYEFTLFTLYFGHPQNATNASYRDWVGFGRTTDWTGLGLPFLWTLETPRTPPHLATLRAKAIPYLFPDNNSIGRFRWLVDYLENTLELPSM